MRRQRGDGAIGLRIGQTFRCRASDALLVDGIDQRRRIRAPRENPSEQRIERWRSDGLVHGVTLIGSLDAFTWLHRFARSASATRFPADSPSPRSLQAFLSDSIARSIAVAR